MSESAGGVTHRMKDEAEQLGQEAQAKVTEVKEQGSTLAREQLDRRTTELGRQTRGLAEALRRSGQQLGQQGGANVDKLTVGVADRLERVGDYLEQARGDDMLRDAERFAREHAWLVAAGAAAVGLAASRVLKASSEGRYDRERRESRPDRYSWAPEATSREAGESAIEPIGRDRETAMAGRAV